MTTSKSPPQEIRNQSDRIARMLKRMQRDPSQRPAKSTAEGIDFGVVQDDKVIRLNMRWDYIAAQTESQLSAIIYAYMSGQAE